MPRLFVAIRPPAPIRQQLTALQEGVDGARWQDDEQLHITLRFIGDIDPHTGEDVVDALHSVRTPPFEIALRGTGSFDRRGRIEALWAGLAPHEPLANLHRKIDQALVRIGLPHEGRAYLPHISLARGRMAAPEAFLAAQAGLTSPPFAVTHFALFESVLGREGARYTVVERWALG
jgi:RNA 2',3'-cyclic 3'-phosphodiesterase